MTETSKHKSKQELGEFGQVMALALLILSILLCSAGHLWWHLVAGAGVVFILAAYFYPLLLAPVERVWMALALVLSAIMTRVILILTFCLGIIPMALLVRLLGKDLLSLRWDAQQESYWVDVDRDGPGARHYLPY